MAPIKPSVFGSAFAPSRNPVLLQHHRVTVLVCLGINYCMYELLVPDLLPILLRFCGYPPPLGIHFVLVHSSPQLKPRVGKPSFFLHTSSLLQNDGK